MEYMKEEQARGNTDAAVSELGPGRAGAQGRGWAPRAGGSAAVRVLQ